MNTTETANAVWFTTKGQVVIPLRLRKPGAKPFAEEWAEHKHEERELEDAKYARSTGAR